MARKIEDPEGSEPDSKRPQSVNRRWTKDDMRFLRQNAALLPRDQIAQALGRTTLAVSDHASRKRIRLLRPGKAPDALDLERSARLVRRP